MTLYMNPIIKVTNLVVRRCSFIDIELQHDLELMQDTRIHVGAEFIVEQKCW